MKIIFAARKAECNKEHTIKRFERCHQFFVYWTIYPYITFFAVKSSLFNPFTMTRYYYCIKSSQDLKIADSLVSLQSAPNVCRKCTSHTVHCHKEIFNFFSKMRLL
jgi:hypothetical protein